jgi:hypothetical protein
MGDSTSPMRLRVGLSPAFAGSKILCALILGLTPQALCFRLLRRLRTTFGVESVLAIVLWCRSIELSYNSDLCLVLVDSLPACRI